VKPWKVVVIVHLVILALIMAFAWYVLRRGFSARARPSSIETLMATTARKLAVPSSYRTLHNNVPASPESIRAGMEHFADHCATCHANDGSGDTMFGRGMYPKPPDMRLAATQNKSDGELCYTIQNGVRLTGMPAFGEEYASAERDTETWQLVLFIRHLPELTAAERSEMEQLNPKTEKEREEEKQEQEFLNEGVVPEKSPSESHHHH
jgi:mono/diheme cytochrome c family protein